MKQYPSIKRLLREDLPTSKVYLFDKIDGSNIRAQWNKKQGFYKFGTRTSLIDSNSPFNKAIELIKNKYTDDLSEVFRNNKWDDVICFFEFFGPSSFAGSHSFEEKMNVVLFDVDLYKKGMMTPAGFIKYFGHLDIAQLLYCGTLTEEIFDSIKQSSFSGMTFEGVVAKGESDKNNQTIMYKIKSQAWLDKLKTHCKGNKALYASLE